MRFTTAGRREEGGVSRHSETPPFCMEKAKDRQSWAVPLRAEDIFVSLTIRDWTGYVRCSSCCWKAQAGEAGLPVEGGANDRLTN